MIEIGKYNDLTILRLTSVGLFLGDDQGEDVLLPNKYCPEDYEIGDVLRVFVYLDYDERKIATNLTPYLKLNEFALLRVADVADVGAFLEWGLEKHLLVPFTEQRQRMQVGRSYIVYLALDEKTERLYGTNKINKRLDNTELTVRENDKVDLLVYKATELGYSVIINNLHSGLIYADEAFKELNVGEKLEGYIKKIREENKLDVSLQPIGFENHIDLNCQKVLDALERNNGFLGLTDKSNPNDISSALGMSKKTFKKAVGTLYRERKIVITDTGIKLV